MRAWVLRGSAGRRPAPRELAIAALAVAAVGAAAFGPYVAHGGLYWDDWENAATTRRPPPGFLGPVELRVLLYRPVLALLLPLPYELAGVHPAPQLAIAVGLSVAMAWSFYLLVRTAGLPARHAGPVAVLTLLFPYSSATRLWPTGALNNVAVILLLLGLCAGLRAMDADGRRAPRLRLGAGALYVLAILAYEVVAVPALMGSLALYAVHSGRRAAWRQWRWQAVAIVVTTLFVAAGTTRHPQSPAGAISHAAAIGDQATMLLARAIVPVGSPPVAAVLGVVALLVAVSAASGRGPGAWGLRLFAAGVLTVGAGYAMFVPSSPAYAPLNDGLGDRMNLVAALGFALAAYGTALMAGGLAGRFGRGAPWASAVVGAGLVGAIAFGYLLQGRERQRRWERASDVQSSVLRGLREHPRLAAGSTVFTAGHPRYAAPGVPVFATSWDLNGAVRATTGDASLSAYPLGRDRRLSCRPTALGPSPTINKVVLRPRYGSAFLLEVPAGRLLAIDSPARCRALNRWLNGLRRSPPAGPAG